MIHTNGDRNKKQKVFLRGFLQGKNMLESLKSLELAIEIHNGKRKDGQDEFSHQIEMVVYLCQILEHKVEPYQFDIIISSAFLHDLVEDYPNKYSFEDMRNEFGDEITDTVKLLTKSMDFDKYSAEQQHDYYDKMLSNPNAVFVKGADRIHNMQTSVRGLSSKRLSEYVKDAEIYILDMLKKARKLYPEYYLIFISMSHLLERQLYFIEEIIEVKKSNSEDTAYTIN